jgi:hypothetical protein
MNVPPYVPEDLKGYYDKIKPASDLVFWEFVHKIDKQLQDKPKLMEVIKMAFEMGFVFGASFIYDNPDL